MPRVAALESRSVQPFRGALLYAHVNLFTKGKPGSHSAFGSSTGYNQTALGGARFAGEKNGQLIHRRSAMAGRIISTKT